MSRTPEEISRELNMARQAYVGVQGRRQGDGPGDLSSFAKRIADLETELVNALRTAAASIY